MDIVGVFQSQVCLHTTLRIIAPSVYSLGLLGAEACRKIT